MLMLETEPGVTVMLVDARLKRTERDRVEDLVAQGKCLCGCGEDAEVRGLNSRCYQRFRAAANDKSPKDRITFEAQMIRDGLLLPSRQGQRARNPFRGRG